jgi:hypothetical protein
MNINQISTIALRANYQKPQRKLTPLSEYKGPILELRFYEEDEINLLRNQLSSLENEARDVIRTIDINRHLTGYQKEKCKFKLFHIQEAIETINKKIYDIKKQRYAKQMVEYMSKTK